MTGSDATCVNDAVSFVRSSLGEAPAFACVAERGALSAETIIGEDKSCWQLDSVYGGSAPYKVYCGRSNGAPVLLIIESPPFQSARNRTFAARLASRCGCEALVVVTNAFPLTPGLHPDDLLVVTDHVNLLGDSPLIGPCSEDSKFSFCDLTNAYDPELQDDVTRTAKALSIKIHPGVYVASPLAERPDASALETLRESGGDVCGTGLVPHVLAAHDASLKVVALSCLAVADPAAPSGASAQRSVQPSEIHHVAISQLVGRLLAQWSQRDAPGMLREFASVTNGDAKN